MTVKDFITKYVTEDVCIVVTPIDEEWNIIYDTYYPRSREEQNEMNINFWEFDANIYHVWYVSACIDIEVSDTPYLLIQVETFPRK